jgi:hypothetical protein
MKAPSRTTIKALICLAIAATAAMGFSADAAQPNESGAGKVCGVLRTFEGETQIFDYTRTHLGDASFGTKIHCGDWISVDKGKATIEHANGAALLVGENTFIQILDPQSGENPEHAHVALYRGEFLIQAAKAEVRILTPNAVARVERGGAFMLYSTAAEETQIVGMGAHAVLANRFFDERSMTADFAKVVTFSNPVERLLPDEARFVNARELNERLAHLGVADAVRQSLEKAVKAGSKTKMPVTLAVTAKPAPKESIHLSAGGEFASASTRGNRSPASVGEMTVKTIVRKRIVASEPNFALTHHSQEESDKKKLLQALATMRPDDGQ